MTGIPETLAPLAVPVDSLVHYGRNPRRGDVDLIAESLAANGQYRPIVVRSGTNEVLAGNHTLAAARRLGWTRIAATFVDVSDAGARRIVLVDNHTNDRGGYDEEALLVLLEEAEREGDLAAAGYTDWEVEQLRRVLAPTGPEADGPEAFPAFDVDLPAEYCCPSCGFEWSGRPRAGSPGTAATTAVPDDVV